MKLSFTLNGVLVRADADPDERAVDLLRDLGALDVKEGCGTGECGACSVLVDGVHKLSCLLLAAQLAGRELTTAAGLGTVAAPHPIQRAFAEHGAVQCGFCTPGMTIAAAALLARNPEPSRLDARRAISGNLCRCTGYVKIVDAVCAAASELSEAPGGETPGAEDQA
ncbi:MAG: (2Fe-2S)-binding protein [Proteobacteria bacterium]|nr:(2Fe-2S)-binding protein [Pseudomonadota bacterium]